MERQEKENKLVRFFKNWTLPIAISFGSIVYLLFANIPWLDTPATLLSPFFDAIVPMFMFLILYVTFCKVDFHKMRPVQWHLWVALFQMFIVAMLMSVILYYRPTGSELVLMEALLCCVVAPCAAAAPVVTQKLGGNLEQMTTYTFLSNFITALAIPLCFPLIEKDADITFWSAFLTILQKVCIVLVLPMLLAYITKHFIQPLHRRVIAVKDLSYYLWSTSLAVITGVTLKNINHSDVSSLLLTAIALLGLLFCIVQFAVGRWIGHYWNNTTEAGQGLGQKNTAFAIWIAYTYLTPLSSVGPGCYILWQNIINSIEIWQHRKKE